MLPAGYRPDSADIALQGILLHGFVNKLSLIKVHVEARVAAVYSCIGYIVILSQVDAPQYLLRLVAHGQIFARHRGDVLFHILRHGDTIVAAQQGIPVFQSVVNADGEIILLRELVLIVIDEGGVTVARHYLILVGKYHAVQRQHVLQICGVVNFRIVEVARAVDERALYIRSVRYSVFYAEHIRPGHAHNSDYCDENYAHTAEGTLREHVEGLPY